MGFGNSDTDIVISTPLRTAIGTFGGALKDVSATDLGAVVVRESLRRAFEDLVMADTLLDQLGPSLIGQQSLFLYGGTGNGKTSIAERILRIYQERFYPPT